MLGVLSVQTPTNFAHESFSSWKKLDTMFMISSAKLLCSCYEWAAEEEIPLHLIFRDEPSINQKLCDVCGLIKLDGEEGRVGFSPSPEV